MKVLLTGATGFVGSHVLDDLLAREVSTKVLLRASSSHRFITAALPKVEVCPGAIDDPASLAAALADVSHVIHCAGCTKALTQAEYYRVNQQGTRNVVAAVNQRRDAIQRVVHISSLAAAGPATAQSPSRESDPPQPVSEYGRSKLAAEKEVVEQCQAPYVILRPPGVYGPRDGEFLKLFKAIQNHILPRIGGGAQELSLVFVLDLAAAISHCLKHGAAPGKIFNVAHPERVTTRQLAGESARLIRTWTISVPLPTAALWPVCVGQEVISKITGKPNVINRQKYAELAAPGWVCDTSRLRNELDFIAPTALSEGLAKTLAWYRSAGWMR